LEVCNDSQLAEPRHVRGIDQLEVGDVVPMLLLTIGVLCGLNGIQGLTNRPIANGVKVNLKSRRIEPSHRILQLTGLHHRNPTLIGSCSQVRLQQHRRIILHHAVLHDLHGTRVDTCRGILRTQPLEALNLPQPG
jgi:hypothetical protein